ncbi:MAG: hypothetical protein U0894_00800 [Pirellulales bacterium]
MLSPEFLPFIQGAPVRCDDSPGRALRMKQPSMNCSDAHAVEQYQREITLSNVVNVMLDVACGTRRSPRAVYGSFRGDCSLLSAWQVAKNGDLIRRVFIIAHTAKRARQLIQELGGEAEEPVPGYRSVILDGNMLAGTEHRLEPLRKSRAAALPGKALALYECATGLILHAILEEDAYSHKSEPCCLP